MSTAAYSPVPFLLLSPAAVRNAYLLVNYGDFVDGTTTKAQPYVQLLSVTDPAAAHQDFVQTRLGGVDTTGMQVFTASGPDNSPSDVSSHGDHQTKMIVIYSVVAVSLILILSVAGYVILKRRRRRHPVTRPNLDTGLSYDYSSYHPLQHAPTADETHTVQGYHGVGNSSIYDPYAETTSPPKYEERDPWQDR